MSTLERAPLRTVRELRKRSASRRYAARYASLAFEARALLLAHLRALPEPLGGAAARFYESRVARAGSHPLLGEYLPWLSADFLGVSAPVSARVTLLPWLLVYAHVLAVDDVLDRSWHSESPALPVIGALLAQQAVAEYRRLFTDSSEFWRQYDEIVAEMALAGATEILSGRGRPRRTDEQELDAVGRKLSLIRLCSIAVALRAGLPLPTVPQTDALGRLATAVQLLDDVTDWAEDYEAGTLTPLLFKALEAVPEGDSTQRAVRLSRDELLLYLVDSGSLSHCLAHSDRCLEMALQEPSLRADSASGRLLRAIASDARWLKDEADRAGRLVDQEKMRLRPGEPVRLLGRKKRVVRALQRLEVSIRVVAQSS